MGYQLSIDLGTTWTAAAVRRDGVSSMVELSQRSTAVPSVVFLREDGEVLVGEPAERRAASEPGRVAREFKRRIGDSTPLLLGGTPQSAEAVTARLARWVYDLVVSREGGEPDRLVLTHPANWGEFKLDLFRQALVLARIDTPTVLLTEPEAAVLHYAAQERVEPGATVAVYDLGGGTFDAAVLRKGDTETAAFTFLGPPQGIERLGGIDFDEAVFRHVLALVGVDLDEIEPDDTWTSGLLRLRAECVAAKEALSADADTTVSVLLPTVQSEVRVTRGEFEAMIRPTLADTLTVMERAVRTAGIEADELDRILLVGGSSRIPVVSELLASRFGRPLAVDAHPKHAVVLGALLADGGDPGSVEAATAGVDVSTPAGAAAEETPEPVPPASVPPAPAGPRPDAAAGSAPDRGTGAPAVQRSQRRRSPALLVGIGVGLALVVAVAVAVATRGGSTSSADTAAEATATTTTVTETTEAPAATTVTTTEAPTTEPPTTEAPTTTATPTTT
ncbi:MAG: Hsp70 family protein, partial [Actinomyces sp.]